MAQKKRAPWGSKKRAAEEAAAAAAGEAVVDAVDAVEAEAATATNGNGHAGPPPVGDAIENVKNWLAPFDVDTRKQIMKAVNVFLK